TQRLERDVVKVFQDLKSAFEREMKKPKPGQEAGQPNQGGPQRRRLVPALAELKMLKGMQEDVRRQTGDLNEAIKLSGGEPNSMQRELLQRLSTRQGNLADLLDQMNKDLTNAEGEGGK